jgi:16S rRNA (guanine966-N2)-methyltransferase
MRVIAGTAKGRRLVAPAGLDTRPTSDRVRGALFNALGSMGAVDGAVVLDLFAGSGALGIEALSRGAAHVTFVDHDRHAVATIRANLAATGLAERATVVQRDAPSFAGTDPHHYDLALLDPPYDFDGWTSLLAALPAPRAVVESDRAIDAGGPWSVVREKRYGTTVVTIVERAISNATGRATSEE